jgi:hypothetical protein
MWASGDAGTKEKYGSPRLYRLSKSVQGGEPSALLHPTCLVLRPRYTTLKSNWWKKALKAGVASRAKPPKGSIEDCGRRAKLFFDNGAERSFLWVELTH